MANLLRLIVELVEEPDVRRAFRADPEGALAAFDDLTGEDVAAAADVARVQVDPRIAERMTEVLGVRAPGEHDSRAAIRALLALCDATETAAVPQLDLARPGGEALPEAPPGPQRPSYLWAVDGRGETDEEEADRPASLAPVPDPPGGFEFAPLEMVELVADIPEADIEAGTVATIVAVHREPSLEYEIEITSEDGGRRFLGTVPPSLLGRYSSR